MERRKQEEQLKSRWLRGAVRQGLDEIDRGKGVEFSSVHRLDEMVDQIGREASVEVAQNSRRG